MTKEEMALRLNGRQYREEVSPEDKEIAEQSGLIIMYGQSDDLVKLEGAVNGEVSLNDAGDILFGSDGELVENECEDEDCPYFAKMKEQAVDVHAYYKDENFPGSWSFETDLHHATFDIHEDGELFCRGIVLDKRVIINAWAGMNH